MPAPRITYVDAATLDAGDIDFSPLETLGELILHRFTAPDELIKHAGGSRIILTNKFVLSREGLTALAEHLRYVVVTATGVNNVDLDAARELGIPVSNVSGYSTESVAQHTIGLLLNLATGIHRYAAEARLWAKSPMFTRLDHPIFELSGKTLGIVGLGTIGKRVAELAQSFGMRIIALARGESNTEGPIPRLKREQFFAEADAITLHCPLTAENERFINAETIEMIKSGAVLINTGRGPLVDEIAVLDALKSGKLGGAGLDVLPVEPPPADQQLLTADLPNLIVTPHSAWASVESRTRLLDGVCENIRAFLADEEIPNRVA
ncbi:MAG: glycerate dehydrogenase [Verrucomicrobiales bacterium]|jgi:glycerate dehydrogenase